MNGERAAGSRRMHALALLAAPTAPELETKRLCEVCAEVTGMTGAGIMLMAGDAPQGSLCSTDEVSELIEQLQYALGEGPCVDAYQQGRPVLEPDLRHPVTPRWLSFAGPAAAAGARAVFGFPMQLGAVRLGALNLYCDQAGQISDDQHAEALVMAGIAAQAVLVFQAKAPPGSLAVELEANADFHYNVHQAAGMVSVQLGVSVREALVRVRAHSFAVDKPLAAIAQDVVDRRLRFEPENGTNGNESGMNEQRPT